MEWEFKGKYYKTIKPNWEVFLYTTNFDYNNPILVYHPKYNKCYYMESLSYRGNGNNLKAYVYSIYDDRGIIDKSYIYFTANNLELVIPKE